MQCSPSLLCFVVILTGCAGRGPEGTQARSPPTGYWGSTDGGVALVVFDVEGQTFWAPQGLGFDLLAVTLVTDCRDYGSTPDGGLKGPADTNPAYTVVSDGEGRWRLGLELPPEMVDSRYRIAKRGDPSVVQGKVVAQFDGGLTQHEGAVTFSYRIVYRDSVKELGTEGEALDLPASITCP